MISFHFCLESALADAPAKQRRFIRQVAKQAITLWASQISLTKGDKTEIKDPDEVLRLFFLSVKEQSVENCKKLDEIARLSKERTEEALANRMSADDWIREAKASKAAYDAQMDELRASNEQAAKMIKELTESQKRADDQLQQAIATGEHATQLAEQALTVLREHNEPLPVWAVSYKKTKPD